jgi:hypothetical protein
MASISRVAAQLTLYVLLYPAATYVKTNLQCINKSHDRHYGNVKYAVMKPVKRDEKKQERRREREELNIVSDGL